MYNLPQYKETDEKIVKEFIRQHPFAMLIGSSETFPVATQLPVMIEEREGKIFLSGHIMRLTDHHKAFEKHPNVLCVFTGPHAYVSASWYANPAVGSTWNYMSVHAKGEIRFLEEEELKDILQKTTKHFENNDNSPASFHHLSADYINKLIKAIVGFEIEVKKIEHVFKLSQNRDEESFKNIITHLQASEAGAQSIAGEMKKRESQLFNNP